VSGAGPDTIFHGVCFDPRDRTSRLFGRDELDAVLADDPVFCWIDLQGPDIAPLNELLRVREIDLKLVSHFDAPEILPRIVERHDCLAFYLYEIEDPERHLDTRQGLSGISFARMILVLGEDFVITYHRRPLEAVDEIKDVASESFRQVGKTPGFVAFLFLERCLYDYAHLNLANDNALDHLQQKARAGDFDGLADEISVVGTNILTLKKLASSVHIVLMLLATKWSPFISADARTSFGQMEASATAVRAAVDSSRNLLDGIINTIAAAEARRTSEIARVLTIMSGILMPLTLIAGIYGMNFQHMPELSWKNAYFGVLGIMGLVGLGLFVVFRRLGWTKPSVTAAGGPGAPRNGKPR
jgi:magnesium/cobalt transport protein CorA